ncbi:hypothetical protein D3C77_499390 [compost metagenome]
MFVILLTIEHLHDSLDMLVCQHIIICTLFEKRTGINKLDGGITFVFCQHQNVHGDSSAEEQIRR